MVNIWLVLFFFTDIIKYLIFLDIILSWLSLIWLRWRPAFLSSVIDPIYSFINKHIKTSFLMFRFDALIVLMIIIFIQVLLHLSIVWLSEEILKIQNYR